MRSVSQNGHHQLNNCVHLVPWELRCFGHRCASLRAMGSRNPSIRRPAMKERFSASVLICETASCFLDDHEISTKVRLPNTQNTPPNVDLESARFPSKSAS